MDQMLDNPLAFVMAHRNTLGADDLELLQKCIKHIQEQTDPDWQLYIIDDQSTYQPARTWLRELAALNWKKIKLIESEICCGPGHARNQGIQLAQDNSNPVVMFIDSDDLVHPERVRVTREHFSRSEEPLVLYSGFLAVNRRGQQIPKAELTPSLVEILDALEIAPEGLDVWKRIGLETGYLNLTSATSVSTTIAIAHPFPNETISEDSHTWLRYSASGTPFVYEPAIPVQYRTSPGIEGSASRALRGRDFYQDKARVDRDGFDSALELAEKRGTLGATEKQEIRVAFLVRLAQTMWAEKELTLVSEIIDEAFTTNRSLAYQLLIDNADLSPFVELWDDTNQKAA